MLGQITDAPSSELDKTKKIIRELKEAVERYETRINKQEAKLNQGLFLYNYTCTMNTISNWVLDNKPNNAPYDPCGCSLSSLCCYTTVCYHLVKVTNHTCIDCTELPIVHSLSSCNCTWWYHGIAHDYHSVHVILRGHVFSLPSPSSPWTANIETKSHAMTETMAVTEKSLKNRELFLQPLFKFTAS